MQWFLRGLALMVVLGILAAFPAGPLFPWSPVKPGYSHVALERADLYYPAGATLDPAYREVDRMMGEAEQFHRLEFRRRLKIVACDRWEDFERFLPTVRGRNVGAATLETGTVIYVTPKIREMRFDLAEFLRHEISHAIIHQNSFLWNGFEMSRQAWLLEGLAVAFGNQKAYLNERDFRAKAAGENLVALIDPEIRSGGQPGADMRFLYPAWRYFIEHLIREHGRDRFQVFLTEYMKHPRDYARVFSVVYAQSLRGAIRGFEKQLK